MSREHDDIACVSCGYDNGVANLKEREKLQSHIASLQQTLAQDSATRQMKIGVIGAVIVLLSLMLTAGTCSVLEPPDTKIQQHIYPSPIGTMYEEITSTYKYCVQKADNEGERTICTENFADMQRSMLPKLKEWERKKEGL